MEALARPAHAEQPPDDSAASAEIPPQSFLWAVDTVSRLHGLPYDADLLQREFPQPLDINALITALDALGIDAEPAQALDALPAVLLERRAGDAPPRLTLAAQRRGDQLVYLERGSQAPRIGPFTADDATTVLVTRARVAPPRRDEIDAKPQRFGFRWFIPELLKHRKIWRDVLIASLCLQLAGLAVPLFTQVIIDKVIVHQTTNTLLVITVALFAFTAFNGVMSWLREYLVLHTGTRVDAVLGHRVFTHLFRLPLRYFEHRPTGTLVARLQGIETIRDFITGAGVTLLLDLPFLVVFLAVMFWYSWMLTLIVLGILGTIAALSLSVAPVLRARLNEQFQHGARNQAFLTEYITGVETAKSLQMEPQLGQRFGDYLATYLRSSFRAGQCFNTYNVAANTLEQLQTLAVLVVGAWLVMTTNSLTIGMLVAFKMFAGRLSQPVLRIVGLWQQFQQASIAVRRLGDVMDAPAEPYTLHAARQAQSAGGIEVENLAFRYGDDRQWLYRGFYLEVSPGTLVAITGPSGCGKSTLAKLLQGFYQPADGRILIDGLDIRHLAANELRRLFGVVPQETQLFSGSVYDNLKLANPQASFKQVIQACDMAEVHSVIEALPNGYQTEIGESGAGLSGGQKQRLAIARALLRRPRILIFDESTSALDGETADQFARTINTLRGKVTMIVITHRLPKALEVDHCVVMGQEEKDQ